MFQQVMGPIDALSDSDWFRQLSVHGRVLDLVISQLAREPAYLSSHTLGTYRETCEG